MKNNSPQCFCDFEKTLEVEPADKPAKRIGC